ncbi:PREDICTED: uncharacterized protein LOC109232713 [Nicotiana attenuata]|uniref:uncharacterized protein LOC109232713 n=1 Tax=Nicotiana attenuata TaxID=49451 RepID=UPI000904937E|nr:PREDICTED: uncharacterized protein LOC109232713 [Nicotiana attenuata]
MIVCTWNIRGLNKLSKQKELKLFLERQKVDLMGCVETRVKEGKANKILQKVARGWKYCCNYNTAVNGRIWLLWKESINVQIQTIKDQYIHCSIEESSTHFTTEFTVVYAKNTLQKREELWNELHQFGKQICNAWLLSGDFNNGLTTDNRIGQPVTAKEIQGFQELLNNLQLTPIRSIGGHFTWCNKQPVGSRVYSKIDWALGNFQWLQQYGHIEADFLNPGVSDHSPMIMRCGEKRRMYPKPFKFFVNVMEHPEFHARLKKVWGQNKDMNAMLKVSKKLQDLKHELKDLNHYMASYQQRLNQSRQKLEIVQANINVQPFCQSLFDQEKEILAELDRWNNIEEQVLRQKSRANWILCGDSNSKYFHAQWKIRQSKNTISSIYTKTGIKLTDPVQVESKFMVVFK